MIAPTHSVTVSSSSTQIILLASSVLTFYDTSNCFILSSLALLEELGSSTSIAVASEVLLPCEDDAPDEARTASGSGSSPSLGTCDINPTED